MFMMQNFFITTSWLIMNVVAKKKNCFSKRVLNLFQDLFRV